jgi:hypothetical protein
METQNEPKPKRRFVMTPERRAKLMANLEKARLAPKEKVYRKTPKRYAANIGNLAKANAKRHQESERHQAEELRARLEGLFPAPEVPPTQPPSAGPPLGPSFCPPPPCDPPSGRPAGAEELDEAADLIAKRLRKLRAATRREGRRIMRLLTAAIHRSHPLSAEEACKLVRDLLRCLDGTRVVAEARRLNERISRLLLKMMAARYGAEAQVGGVPLATVVEVVEEQWWRREEARAARAAAAENNPPGAATAEEEAEGKKESCRKSREQAKEPSKVVILELPQTLEEFQVLLGRALDMEGESHQYVLAMLVAPLWERLHWWERQGHTERARLERLFQQGEATLPGSFEDLLNRMFDINILLSLDDHFIVRMQLPLAGMGKDLEWWLNRRIQIVEARRRKPAPPVQPPGKPPVGTTPDQPTQASSGSADPSAVA